MSGFDILPSGMDALARLIAFALLRSAAIVTRDFGEMIHLQTALPEKRQAFMQQTQRVFQERMTQQLNKVEPGFSFEYPQASVTSSQNSWIFPRIDGWLNFYHGLPHFSLVAAARQKGKVTAAVIYDPIRHELFWCAQNQGVFLNPQRRLRCSVPKEWSQTLLALGKSCPAMAQCVPDLIKKGASIRQTGASFLDTVYAAAGRFDGILLAPSAFQPETEIMRLFLEEGGLKEEPQEHFLFWRAPHLRFPI